MASVFRVPDIALRECVVELRAACRKPIDQEALETLLGWVRPNFERILGHPDGAKRWADHGNRMRDNSRHLGAFADFFGSHTDNLTIGLDELTRAFQVVRADCTVRAESRPIAWEYCYPTQGTASFDTRAAEDFIRSVAPIPEPV
jgi:hypothetical protein